MSSAEGFPSDVLFEGENILWTGRPRSGVFLSSRDGLLVPFSLIWGGFSIFWETNVLEDAHTGLSMKLFGIPFIVISLYIIFGRFFIDAFIRKNISYTLTNKRIFIRRAKPFENFTALSLARLPELKLVENPDGRGTIYFEPQAPPFSRFAGWTPSLDPTPKFFAIEECQAVFQKIQNALRLI